METDTTTPDGTLLTATAEAGEDADRGADGLRDTNDGRGPDDDQRANGSRGTDDDQRADDARGSDNGRPTQPGPPAEDALWEELVTSALLGTDRRTPAGVAGLAGVSGGELPGALLDAAALHTVR
ncbi:hypothetical protein R6L23_36965, partial [Streptomyces sp. SR27]|nr:hypothetical protein [Streptomyces sp. SR27]